MDAETVDETLELLWDGDRTLIVVSSDLSHQHPCADSPPSLSARFNDGRFRVTTEAKLRPLPRFGCSMVSRLILALRASVSRLKAEIQRIATSRIAQSANRTMQRIVSVILPICVHLRNLRTRNLRLIHPVKQLAQDRAWRCAPTDNLSGLLPRGLFSAHLTVPGGVFVRRSPDQ